MQNKSGKIVSAIFVLLLLFWNYLNFLKLFANELPFNSWMIFLSEIVFTPVCHQNPEKLFHIFNTSCQLCSRCTGIYIGALISSIAVLFIPLKRISTKYLFASIAINLLDGIFYNIGIYSYNHNLTFATGLLFGSLVFYYFRVEIEKLFAK